MSRNKSAEETDSLRVARARYWADNGFGDDGGESKTWEIVKIGPIPIPILNVEARKEAIRFHDLHHVLTGYSTSCVGEAEISAWELSSGCRDKWVAWVLGFQILVLGLVAPKRMLRAWTRGRRTRNLYAETIDEALLDSLVSAQRKRLGLDAPVPEPGPMDAMGFVLWCGLSVLVQGGAVVAGLTVLWWGVQAVFAAS